MKCTKCNHTVTKQDLEVAEGTGFYPQETDKQRDSHFDCECLEEGDVPNECVCDFK